METPVPSQAYDICFLSFNVFEFLYDQKIIAVAYLYDVIIVVVPDINFNLIVLISIKL